MVRNETKKINQKVQNIYTLWFFIDLTTKPRDPATKGNK